MSNPDVADGLFAWMDRGLCVGHPNPNIFFPSSARGMHAQRQREEAERICGECPVQTQCREHKSRTGAAEGVWGGNSRRTPQSKGRKLVQLQPHGTNARYQRHIKDGERPCGSCQVAHQFASRKWERR